MIQQTRPYIYKPNWHHDNHDFDSNYNYLIVIIIISICIFHRILLFNLYYSTEQQNQLPKGDEKDSENHNFRTSSKKGVFMTSTPISFKSFEEL